jgi:hypothetical protein
MPAIRSAWIRAAVRLYLRVKRQQKLEVALRRGYPSMAETNLILAEIGEADAEDWATYEAYLEGDLNAGS